MDTRIHHVEENMLFLKKELSRCVAQKKELHVMCVRFGITQTELSIFMSSILQIDRCKTAFFPLRRRKSDT